MKKTVKEKQKKVNLKYKHISYEGGGELTPSIGTMVEEDGTKIILSLTKEGLVFSNGFKSSVVVDIGELYDAIKEKESA